MPTMYVGDELALGHDDDDDDEELGVDEILGALLQGGDDGDEGMGLDEILGASRRRGRKGKKKGGGVLALARTIALARRAGGVVLKRKEPTDFREQILPFQNTPLTVLAAAPTVTLIAQPQRDFRAKRLIIPSAQAASFVVTDFSIAQEPQFVAPGAIGAQFLSEVGVGLTLKGRTANLGALISLTVTNISGVNVNNFAPGILGDVVM